MTGIPVGGPKIPDVSQLQEVSKQVGKTGSDQGKFGAVLKGVSDQSTSQSAATQANAMNTSGAISSAQALPRLTAQKVSANSPLNKVQSTGKDAPVKSFLNSVVGSQNQMNSLVQQAMSGKPMSQQNLLVMQAGINKASTTLSFAGNLVGQLTSGLKTLLQTQV